MQKLNGIPVLIFILFLTSCKESGPPRDYTGWRTYAGSKDGIRYSSNEQINTANVAQLQVAWSYSSGDKDPENRTQNQCNPIVVDGILYGTSPRLKLLAMDAATGELKWLFDPATIDESTKNDPNAFFKVSRGVVYWQDEKGIDKRILYNVGAKMYAINAADGSHIGSFGKNGFVDMSEDLGREKGDFNDYIGTSTPGVIYHDLYIVGTRVAESADAAPGHVRAYDVRTGKLAWIFHTIPHPGETGYDTWPDKDAWKKLGGANSWAGMTLDEKTGIVYIPTGTVSGDFYGGFRKGQNLFGNSLIALDAATGKYIWHYQVIHHDLWDRDLPTNPNLVTVNHDGKKIEAIAQITKHGFVFLLDRATGQPVFPIEEKAFPTSGLPGEDPWPTQPIPTLPEPFARQKFAREDVSDLTAETHAELLEKFDHVADGAMFTPPSKEGVWIFPGYDGGGEWGGAAVDPESAILYVNSSEMPWALTMIDVLGPDGNDDSPRGIGKALYSRYCVSCHGPELKGNGTSFPSLVDLKKKYKQEQVLAILEKGKNMMPAFRQFQESEKQALITFLFNLGPKDQGTPAKKEPSSAPPAPGSRKSIMDEVLFTTTGYNRFLDKNGYPGIKPPWGTLNAVDLNSGKLLWKVPHGEYAELTQKGIPKTGTENYGGPLVTKGGLIFIAGTKDEKIRAYDKLSGKVLWEAPLPAAGFATPATYSVHGNQYVVIACGGGKIGNKSGDHWVAFALPGTKK